MKVRLTTALNTILAMILSLLGFSSCKPGLSGGTGSIDGGGENLLMYGCPTVKYNVKGIVTDADDNPINGIEVTLRSNNGDRDAGQKCTTTSQEDGKFACSISDFDFGSGSDIQLTFHDVDGEENGGEFEDKSIDVTDLEGESEQEGAWITKREITTTVKLEKRE